MRIAFILTYPIYHDSVPFKQWLAQPCRERRLAGLFASCGHDVEFWGIGEEEFHRSYAECGSEFMLRIFRVARKRSRSKRDVSDDLVDHARTFNADLHVLKGVDGGAGTLLIKNYLKEKKRSLVFILGGGYQSRYHALAKIVFYESDEQKRRLMEPGWRVWQTPPAEEALIRLPKWVDAGFVPQTQAKEWDILIIGRLIRKIKNFEPLGSLAGNFSVAVIGDGEDAQRLQAAFPKVHWLGFIPNRELPGYINRARLLMHTGLREFYPRVVAEAMSCGVPCAAFSGLVGRDVIPAGCGLLMDRNNYITPLKKLIEEPERLHLMGKQATRHAHEHIGRDPCKKAIQQMFDRLATAQRALEFNDRTVDR